MAEPKDLISEILKAWPLSEWQSSTLVVAVSGGADSTSLLDILFKIRPDRARTIVAHFNHSTRGAESDEDERFVAKMARDRELTFFSDRRQVDSANSHISEAILREDRYRFLKQVAFESKTNIIVLGHHADDQVETFIHRLLRGTGPRGLCGMSVEDRMSTGLSIIRPMLHCRRADILAYLESSQIPFRIDRSNESNDYTRNKIRNELVPLLRSFARTPKLDERLLQSMELLRQQQSMIDEMAGEVLETEDIEYDEDSFSIPRQSMLGVPWPVQQQVFVEVWHRMGWPLREMSFAHWERVRELMGRSNQDTHPKKLDLPGHIHMHIRGKRMTLTLKRAEGL